MKALKYKPRSLQLSHGEEVMIGGGGGHPNLEVYPAAQDYAQSHTAHITVLGKEQQQP